MANAEHTTNEPSGPPARLTWEPMSLTRIGAFEDVLRGGTGKGGDLNEKKV
jgi:hypothetical protein